MHSPAPTPPPQCSALATAPRTPSPPQYRVLSRHPARHRRSFKRTPGPHGRGSARARRRTPRQRADVPSIMRRRLERVEPAVPSCPGELFDLVRGVAIQAVPRRHRRGVRGCVRRNNARLSFGARAAPWYATWFAWPDAPYRSNVTTTAPACSRPTFAATTLGSQARPVLERRVVDAVAEAPSDVPRAAALLCAVRRGRRSRHGKADDAQSLCS